MGCNQSKELLSEPNNNLVEDPGNKVTLEAKRLENEHGILDDMQEDDSLQMNVPTESEARSDQPGESNDDHNSSTNSSQNDSDSRLRVPSEEICENTPPTQNVAQQPQSKKNLSLELTKDTEGYEWLELVCKGEKLIYFNPLTGTSTPDKPENFDEIGMRVDSNDSLALAWIRFPVEARNGAEQQSAESQQYHYFKTETGEVFQQIPPEYVEPKEGAFPTNVVQKFIDSRIAGTHHGSVSNLKQSEDESLDQALDQSGEGSTGEHSDLNRSGSYQTPGPPSPDATPRSVSDIRAKFQSGDLYSPSSLNLHKVKEDRRLSHGEEILTSEDTKHGLLNEKIKMLQKSGVERTSDMSPPRTPTSQITAREIHSDISKGSVKERSKNFTPEYSPMRVQVVDEIRMAEMQEEVAHRKSSAQMKDYWATVEEINSKVVTRKDF